MVYVKYLENIRSSTSTLVGGSWDQDPRNICKRVEKLTKGERSCCTQRNGTRSYISKGTNLHKLFHFILLNPLTFLPMSSYYHKIGIPQPFSSLPSSYRAIARAPKNKSSPRPVSVLPLADFLAVAVGAVPVAVELVLTFTKALAGTRKSEVQLLS